MDFNFLEREVIQDALFQCEQALHNHQQWHNLIIRSLVCKLPPNEQDVDKNSYKKCLFGQWYYANKSKILKQHPSFIALGEEHKKMHQTAERLLTDNLNNVPIKPYEYDTFANSIERMHLEIADLQRELRELIYSRDPLTGAINRTNMLSLLREQQSLVQRNMQKCSIVMIDVDDFKEVNDKHGHTIGDSVLACIARHLIENVRPYDKVFRYGGEEFLLCLQSATVKSTFEMTERLRTGIELLKIKVSESESTNVTVSAGIASIEANQMIEQSIEHADQALYEAKNNGKNCVKIWNQI